MKPARISQVVLTEIIRQMLSFRTSNKLKNQVATCECDIVIAGNKQSINRIMT